MRGSTHQQEVKYFSKKRGKGYSVHQFSLPLQGAIVGIDLILLPLHWSRSSFSESRERIRTALASVGVGPSLSVQLPPLPLFFFYSHFSLPCSPKEQLVQVPFTSKEGRSTERWKTSSLSLSLSLSPSLSTLPHSPVKKSRDLEVIGSTHSCTHTRLHTTLTDRKEWKERKTCFQSSFSS